MLGQTPEHIRLVSQLYTLHTSDRIHSGRPAARAVHRIGKQARRVEKGFSHPGLIRLGLGILSFLSVDELRCDTNKTVLRVDVKETLHVPELGRSNGHKSLRVATARPQPWHVVVVLTVRGKWPAPTTSGKRSRWLASTIASKGAHIGPLSLAPPYACWLHHQ
jgi:hypothetical protein